MYVLHTGDLVRLRQPAPALWLPRGEMGVVQNSFVCPSVAYEVEFHPRGRIGTVTTLVSREQVDALAPSGRVLSMRAMQ
jgi:hypothetical protein